MGLEVVLNEILARGAEEERTILQQAEAEKRKLLDAAEGEADEIRARALQETRNRVEALAREQRSAAEFEVRRRYLTAQRELAEDFRGRVLAELAKLAKPRREKLLTALAQQVAKDIPKGMVHAPKDDMAILAKVAPNWGKGEATTGAGGFQVESQDRTVVVDQRFETRLESLWKDLQAQTRELFEV